MHVVLAGAAEIRERIPSGFLLFSAWCSRSWPLSTGHLTPEASPGGLLFSQVASRLSHGRQAPYMKTGFPRASLDPGFGIPDDSPELTEHYFYQFCYTQSCQPCESRGSRVKESLPSEVCYRVRGEFSAFYSEYNGRPPGGFKYGNSRDFGFKRSFGY